MRGPTEAVAAGTADSSQASPYSDPCVPIARRALRKLEAVHAEDESASALDGILERLQFLSLPPEEKW